MADSDLILPKHQRCKNPASLYRFVNVGRQVRDTRCTAREPIQGIGEVFRYSRWLQLEFLDDLMKIRILKLQNLVEPVHDFYVGVTSQFAEGRCTLNGLKADCIELANSLDRLISDTAKLPRLMVRDKPRWASFAEDFCNTFPIDRSD